MALILSKYLLTFVAACIEGPLVALGAGFLVRLGYLSIIPAYIALLFGDFIPDTIYYYIGRFGNRRLIFTKYGKYLKMTEEHEKALENLWLNHGKKTMFIGKLAYGLSIPFIISAGLAKLPATKFWFYAIPVTLFQYGVLMTAGYYFGQSYEALIGHYFRFAEITIAASVFIFFLGLYILRKWFATYTQKTIFK